MSCFSRGKEKLCEVIEMFGLHGSAYTITSVYMIMMMADMIIALMII